MENYQSRKFDRHKLHAQKGVAMILLVTLMPLVLVVITFLYVGTTQIEMRSSLLQTCRVELMAAQNEAVPYLKALLALNKLVDIVKWADFVASIADIVLKPFVFLAPAVEAILLVSKSAKKAIPLIQKAILIKMVAGMTMHLYSAQTKIKRILRDYSQKTNGLLEINSELVFGNFLRELSVEPVNPKANLTKYRLKDQFESKQKLFLAWHYQLETDSKFGSWSHWQQSFYGNCATTLPKEEPWQPTLYAAKFFSKL